MAATRAFLLATLQGGGNVPPELGLARRLVSRGHRVHVLGEPSFAAEAEAVGCSFSAWPTAPFADAVSRDRQVGRDWDLRTPGQVAAFVRDMAGFLFGAADRFAADVLTTLDRVPADAVLVESGILGALAGAERAGLPTVALMPNAYLRPVRGRPVTGTGWRPARGPIGRVRDRAAPAAFDWLIDRGLPRLNAVRADLGLPPLPHVFGALDRCSRVLVMTSPSFDPPPPRPPANVRYVGPVTDDPVWADGEVPLPPGSAPLVLVAMSSTYQAHQEVLRRAVAALAGLPVRGLVTLGPGLREGEVRGAGDVAVVPTAPHATVLREAAAVVTHAGHGTVVKALAAGVPMVCLPHGRDQGDNAARVVAAGAGLRLSRRSSVDRLREAVRRVVDDPAFTRSASRMAALMADEARRGPSAVAEIEAAAGVVSGPEPADRLDPSRHVSYG